MSILVGLSKSGTGMFLAQLLKGEGKLWHAWWLFWLLPSVLLTVLAEYLVLIFQSATPQISGIVSWLVSPPMGFFTILGPFAIWKCSPNAKRKIWRLIARVLIVLDPIFFTASSVNLDPSMKLNLFFQLAIIFSVCIILTYLMGKILRSQKLIFLLNQYIAPYLLLAGGAGLFFGSLQ